MHQHDASETPIRIDDDVAVFKNEEQNEERVEREQNFDSQLERIAALRIIKGVNDLIRQRLLRD